MVRLLTIALGCTVLWAATASAAGPTVVDGDAGANNLFGTGSHDVLNGFAGNDRLFGLRGGDVLNGGENDDILAPSAGEDTVNGAGGADQIFDDDAVRDFLNGGADNDTVYAANGHGDRIDCGDGTGDVAYVDPSDLLVACETVVSPGGTVGPAPAINPLFGTNTRDALTGTANADVIFGLRGKDSVQGLGGGDDLVAGPAADTSDGGSGSDRLISTDGAKPDLLNGGSEGDTIFSADGKADSVSCGDGTDQAFVDSSDSASGCETLVSG